MNVTPIKNLGLKYNGREIDSLDMALFHRIKTYVPKDEQGILDNSKYAEAVESIVKSLSLPPEKTDNGPINWAALNFKPAHECLDGRIITVAINERGYYTLMYDGGDPNAPCVE